MRVTWLSFEWPNDRHHTGGVGRYLARLAAQIRDEVDLSLITFDGAVHTTGINVLRLPAPTSRLGRYYLSAWDARHIIASTAPDVVHTHGDDFCLPRFRPTVRSFYGSSWNEARTSRGMRRLNHTVLAAAEQLSRVRADVRLGIAPESVELFGCQYVFPPFLPGKESSSGRVPSSVPTVAFIGSFHGRKQGWLVEEALTSIRAEGKDVRLQVIGPWADRSNWAPWVDHRSGLSDDQVLETLRNSWVLAAPSSYEGFGIPMVEALEQGLRVVCLQNPGSSYLKSLRMSSELPLLAVAQEEFRTQLAKALDLDPTFTKREKADADALVRIISGLGAPQRLLKIYSDALGARERNLDALDSGEA